MRDDAWCLSSFITVYTQKMSNLIFHTKKLFFFFKDGKLLNQETPLPRPITHTLTGLCQKAGA